MHFSSFTTPVCTIQKTVLNNSFHYNNNLNDLLKYLKKYLFWYHYYKAESEDTLKKNKRNSNTSFT